MNNVESAIRQALLELADEGRPVPLGRRALARVRLRRRRRTVALTVLTAVAIIVAVPPLLWADRRPPRPVPDLAGRDLVAAYLTTTQVRVLNPATGRYRTTGLLVETVSTDLRFAAGTRPNGYVQSYPAEDPRLGVLDTRSGDLKWIVMPLPIKSPTWQPGGERVLALVADLEHTRAVLVDPARDEATVISLAIPADRFLVGLCWSDSERLLAVTFPRPDASAPPVQDLIVMDKTGRSVRTISVPDTWKVRCSGREGRVVATRLVEQPRSAGAVVPPEAAIIDLNSGTVSTPVRLPWAGAIDPMAWRSDTSFVAGSQHDLLIVDLEVRTVTLVDDAPAKPQYSLVLSTEGLPGPYPATIAEAAF